MTNGKQSVRTSDRTVRHILTVGFKLFLIAALIAAMLALVYEITLEPYEKNVEKRKLSAIQSVFQCEDLTYQTDSAEDAVIYTVYRNADLIGYCVQLSTSGFGGEMSLMVGYSADRTILGVQLISHSETPGLGAKVENAEYLSQYRGKSGSLTFKDTFGGDVDAVSGATVSSTAVLNGVNRATEVLRMYAEQEERIA